MASEAPAKARHGGGGVGRMVILPALLYFGLMPVKAMHRTPPFALDPRQVGSSLVGTPWIS